MNIPNIVNIQRYSLHDGNGVRTTVFFKGCLLSCIWCHNPESQNLDREFMFNKEKCKGCYSCLETCPEKAINKSEDGVVITKTLDCVQCEKCIDFCPMNAREFVGDKKSVENIVKEIDKDRIFYDNTDGGVTLSGGEVMIQDIDFIVELLKKLKTRGYNLAIETCGFAPYKNYEAVLPYVDMFLYDIKIMDAKKHKLYMGKSNEIILENLKNISKLGAKINIRIPTIGGVNDDTSSMTEIINFLKESVNTFSVNLLPYHSVGSSKYERLGIEYKGKSLTTPSNEKMEHLKDLFISNGFLNTKIGG